MNKNSRASLAGGKEEIPSEKRSDEEWDCLSMEQTARAKGLWWKRRKQGPWEGEGDGAALESDTGTTRRLTNQRRVLSFILDLEEEAEPPPTVTRSLKISRLGPPL